MAIHFSPQELRLRRDATTAELAARGLAGLLIFRQESMYYLTGYDTFGYCFFQCLFLGTDGRMTLLTRAPDLRQARHTSVIDDVRVWVDGPEADPAQELIDILAEHDCRDRTLGMEFDSYGLTAHNWRRIETALASFCTLRDALENCRQALRPGRPLGGVFDVHARTLHAAGYRAHRLNACGYSLGATYAPIWMDWPMLYAGNPTPAQPDMVFFIHIILMDSDADRAMSLGQTVRVTETGCEALSRAPLEIAMT